MFSTRNTGQSSCFTSDSAKSSSAATSLAMPARSAFASSRRHPLPSPAGGSRRQATAPHRATPARPAPPASSAGPAASPAYDAGRIHQHHLRRRMARLALRLLLQRNLQHAVMRVRVVCGLWVTIASFSPTSAFSSVHLPALGRPTIDTNPDEASLQLLVPNQKSEITS